MIVAVKITPDGFGTVTGAGEYLSGDEVTLTATSTFPQYQFLYFKESGNTHDSPYVFTAGSEDVTVDAIFDYKLFDDLKQKVGNQLEDGQIISVIVNRGLSVAVQNSDVSEKDQDLCYADCLKLIVVSYDYEKYKREGHSESFGHNNKDNLIYIMNNLYDKWGEPTFGSTRTSVSNGW